MWEKSISGRELRFTLTSNSVANVQNMKEGITNFRKGKK
jgi:hypothetical protein